MVPDADSDDPLLNSTPNNQYVTEQHNINNFSLKGTTLLSVFQTIVDLPKCCILGRHGSVSLCRVERENKMAATYNVLAFKR